jgi:hypothetical protein
MNAGAKAFAAAAVEMLQPQLLHEPILQRLVRAFDTAFRFYCSGKRDGLDAGPAELGRARLEGCSGPS